MEQIIRPTGLIDPEISVRPVKGQVDDLLGRSVNGSNSESECSSQRSPNEWQRIYQNICSQSEYECATCTPKSTRLNAWRSFEAFGRKNRRPCRNQPLREGLDLPEVSLVAILDADKEGFLRNARSLIQTVGRAARNASGKAILVCRQNHHLDAGMPRRNQPKKGDPDSAQ